MFQNSNMSGILLAIGKLMLMQPSTYVCSLPPLCTTYAEMQFLYGHTCSQYSTVHSSDTAVNGVSVTVLLNLHPLFCCVWVWQLHGSVPTWRHFCWTEDPNTGWLTGVEGTEDFFATLSIPASSLYLGVSAGSVDSVTVSILEDYNVTVEFSMSEYEVSESAGEVDPLHIKWYSRNSWLHLAGVPQQWNS